jgi:hypothetical protein
MGLSVQQLRALRQMELALRAQDPRLHYKFTAWGRILADREQLGRCDKAPRSTRSRAVALTTVCCAAFLIGWAVLLVIVAL